MTAVALHTAWPSPKGHASVNPLEYIYYDVSSRSPVRRPCAFGFTRIYVLYILRHSWDAMQLFTMQCAPQFH